MKKKSLISGIISFIFIYAFICFSVQAEKNIKVGIYKFKPLVYKNQAGEPKGLYIDVLEKIAKEEGWNLDYVYGTWPQCLKRLEKGKIDLLTGILKSKERAKKFDFSRVSVISTWGQIYASTSNNIANFLDLDGKKIAVVKKGYFLPKLKQYLKEFEVNAEFIKVDTYEKVFEMVHQGKADVCSAERITGLEREPKYNIRKTPIIYNHKKFLFATPKGNRGILKTIDRHLIKYKTLRDSVYNNALEKYLYKSKKVEVIPVWLKWVIFGTILILGVVFFFIYYLKRLVRKKTKELRKSEENLRITLNSIGEGIISTDEAIKIVGMNPMAEKLTGWSKEEAYGKSLHEVFNIRNAVTGEFPQVSLDEVIKKGKVLGLANHTILRSRDGTEYQIADSASPIRDEENNVNGMVIVFRDETEKYRQENLLKTERRRLSDAVEGTKAGTWEWNLKRDEIIVNYRWAKILGYELEELKPISLKTWEQFFYEDDLKKSKEILDKHFKGELDYYKCEARLKRKNGEWIWVFIRGKITQLTEDNKPLLMSGTQLDITERKKAEEKLKKENVTDDLTGLYNRSFFEEELERMAGKSFYPLAIIVCDINGLKIINDSMGHKLGDTLIKNTAKILKQCFREDILARIGGDEFAVLLPKTNEDYIKKCRESIREAVSNYNQSNNKLGLSLSTGYAIDYNVPNDIYDFFRRADNHMYKEKMQQKYSSRSGTVEALTKTLEVRDFITEGHADRLQKYAQLLGKKLGISDEKLEDMKLLAKFHDIGKVGISDNILFKPGKLTEEEFEKMKQHSIIGYRIAVAINDISHIAEYILKHHEWWNGKGYPLGLTETNIPLECRIMSIVDAYDAMTSSRPYKKAMSSEEAQKELKRCAGTQFDPDLVEKFIDILQGNDTEQISR